MKTFTSVAQMKLAVLTAGQQVETTGYGTSGDGGGAKYLIEGAQAVDGFADHTLAGGTVAILQERGNLKHYGANTIPLTTDMTGSVQAVVDDDPNPFIPDEGFLVTSTIVVPDDRTITGPGTIKGSAAITSILSVGNNFKLDGVTLDGTLIGEPFWGVNSQDKDNVTVVNCTLNDARCYIDNDAAAVHKNVFIRNNIIDCDFTGSDYLVSQFDPISVFGMENIHITGNTIRVNKVHRVIKISDNPTQVVLTEPAMSDYSSNHIHVSNNTITGSTDSAKQVMDFFIGAGNLVVSNNVVDVTGFGSIFEDKTNHNVSAGGTNPTRSIVIDGNMLTNDGQIIAMQGSFGITEAGFNDDRLGSCIINGNSIHMLASSAQDVISVRFLNKAVITGNDITTAEEANRFGVEVLSNEVAIISDNALKNCAVHLGFASTNSSGDTYTGEQESIIISNNAIHDFDTGAAVQIDLMQSQPQLSISILDNSMRTDRVLTQSGRPIDARTSQIGFFRFVGNSYESTVGGIAAPVFISTFQTKARDYHSNSWQPTITWSTVQPTAGIYNRGDTIYDSNVSAGGVQGWVCTADGSFSTALDVTGDTDGLTAVITDLTDTSDFFVNEYVTVSAGMASAATPYRIIALTASTMTLDSNSTSAQSNVTIVTVDPVFKTLAAIAA